MVRPLLFLALVLLAACGGQVAPPAPAAPAAAPAAPTGPHEVVVFATASLKQPFATLASRYEAAHPGAKVSLRTDGGQPLLDAMNRGEACDVVAIGDNSLMSKFAAAAHLASGSATEVARNRIAIAVAKGNPKQVKGLADFGRADLRIGLGARSASIGRHGRWVLSRLQLDPKPTVEAPTADALLTKVAAGECDAAVVYATSFGGVDGVERLAVPEADNTPVLYSIAATRTAKEPAGAAAFRALCLSAEGQQVFAQAGFLEIGAK